MYVCRHVRIYVCTLPDRWSGTTKLKIDLNPGASSSTVTVVKSWRQTDESRAGDGAR